MKNIDRLAGRMYPGVIPEIINLDYCATPIPLYQPDGIPALSGAEASQLSRLRREPWAAQGRVDPYLVWDEIPIDAHGYVSEVKNVRRVAVVTHRVKNRTISVVACDLDGAL